MVFSVTKRVASVAFIYFVGALLFASSGLQRIEQPPPANISLPQHELLSPACRPSFGSANRTISRIYFYHTRKAGGTSLRYFLQRFAMEYNLTMKESEYQAAESPVDILHDPRGMAGGKFGTESDTLYVTIIREPVARSISHFKYSGRWPCSQLVNNASFVPDESNAARLETWAHPGGHSPTGICGYRRQLNLADCAVNCYTRWFSDRPCAHDFNLAYSFEVAKRKLKGYHLIVVTDWLSDKEYVRQLEEMFGIRGFAQKPYWCGTQSKRANAMHPLIIQNKTMHRLRHLNEVDRKLFDELTSCPRGVVFPKFEAKRFQGSREYQCFKVGVASGKCDESPQRMQSYKVIREAQF